MIVTFTSLTNVSVVDDRLSCNVTVFLEKVVCYYGTWAAYRHGNGKFGVENIDPYLCTHIVYSFLGISPDGSLKILDEYLDLEENWGRGNIKKFVNLKKTNPKLKLMIAVGGWNEGSLGFSSVGLFKNAVSLLVSLMGDKSF